MASGAAKQVTPARLRAGAGRAALRSEGGQILRDPEVLEGKPFLAGTRMGVHSVIGYWQTYAGDVDRILREFPHLAREQIDAALAFYCEHESQRAEIDGILQQNRAAYEEGLANQTAARRKRSGRPLGRFGSSSTRTYPLR